MFVSLVMLSNDNFHCLYFPIKMCAIIGRNFQSLELLPHFSFVLHYVHEYSRWW